MAKKNEVKVNRGFFPASNRTGEKASMSWTELHAFCRATHVIFSVPFGSFTQNMTAAIFIRVEVIRKIKSAKASVFANSVYLN